MHRTKLLEKEKQIFKTTEEEAKDTFSPLVPAQKSRGTGLPDHF